MRRLLSFFLILCLLPCLGAAETLTCDVSAPVHAISPTLYGLFFEDINHAADGGLYAELLQNRSFENEDLTNPSLYQHLTGWQFNTAAGGDGKASVQTDTPLNDNNPAYVSIQTQTAGYAFQNLGYGCAVFRGGIAIAAGESYDVSVWLRSKEFDGTVSVALTTKAGELLSAAATFSPGKAWEKHTDELIAKATVEDACLTFVLNGTGELDVDMASLMPQDRVGADWPGGGLRRDLVEALKELRPRVLRFPGGCVTEGSWVWDNLYRWKDTVGPVEARKENWNTWGYMQCYGIGFYEYFCLCEELGALPLPVVGSGVLCQAREPYESPMNEDELAAWTEDILDLLEFALGGSDTVWGGLRRAMGHEAPFDLRYLAIGNENWADVYFTRYEKIRNAVKAAYPDITCVVACGPVADGSLFNASRARILRSFPDDTADEHYYMESDWFLRNTHRYDHYPRGTKILLGEYAAHEPAAGGRRPNNLYSALCEAAYLTGIERNSDVVTLCCYAPLLARLGMDQWTPDLIWFSGTQVVRTPNYYVQQMFSRSLGDQLIESAMTNDAGEKVTDITARLYHTASVSQDGRVYVKLVNVSGQEKTITLQLLGGDFSSRTQGSVTLLTGAKQDTNSLTTEKVLPVESALAFSDGAAQIILPGYAAMVITVP